MLSRATRPAACPACSSGSPDYRHAPAASTARANAPNRVKTRANMSGCRQTAPNPAETTARKRPNCRSHRHRRFARRDIESAVAERRAGAGIPAARIPAGFARSPVQPRRLRRLQTLRIGAANSSPSSGPRFKFRRSTPASPGKFRYCVSEMALALGSCNPCHRCVNRDASSPREPIACSRRRLYRYRA